MATEILCLWWFFWPCNWPNYTLYLWLSWVWRSLIYFMDSQNCITDKRTNLIIVTQILWEIFTLWRQIFVTCKFKISYSWTSLERPWIFYNYAFKGRTVQDNTKESMDHNRWIVSRSYGCLVQNQIPSSHNRIHFLQWSSASRLRLQNVWLTNLLVYHKKWRLLR